MSWIPHPTGHRRRWHHPKNVVSWKGKAFRHVACFFTFPRAGKTRWELIRPFAPGVCAHVCRFKPLPGHCNILYIVRDDLYSCRTPGCTWSGKSKMGASHHARRIHHLPSHVFEPAMAQHHQLFDERRERHPAATRSKRGRASGGASEEEVRVWSQVG